MGNYLGKSLYSIHMKIIVLPKSLQWTFCVHLCKMSYQRALDVGQSYWRIEMF